MLKKALACVLTVLVSASVFLKAYSAEIDGIDNGYEWDGATSYVLIDGESNCGIDFGTMKLIMDNENSAVYFCFMLKDRNLEVGNLKAGVSLCVYDSEPFVFTAESIPESFDLNKYSFEGAVSVDENNGATCEIRLGIKDGLPELINGSVQFIDSEGRPSNQCDFSIVNEGYIERTADVLMPTADNNDPAYNPGLTETKTTRSQNTTTEKKTTKASSKTSTLSDYKTEEFIINTSPPYSYSRTTRVKTQTATEIKTESLQTTEKRKQNNAVTVYHYEKEIIISQVYVEPKTAQLKEESSNVSTSLSSSSLTTEILNETLSENNKQNVSVSEGMKYKYVIAAVASTFIVLLAAWSAKGSSGKKQKESDDSD